MRTTAIGLAIVLGAFAELGAAALPPPAFAGGCTDCAAARDGFDRAEDARAAADAAARAGTLDGLAGRDNGSAWGPYRSIYGRYRDIGARTRGRIGNDRRDDPYYNDVRNMPGFGGNRGNVSTIDGPRHDTGGHN